MRTVPAAAVALLLAALVAGGPGVAAEKDPEERFAYVRDAATPSDAVRRAIGAARERGAESVAFVLDHATFDPPEGLNEFTADAPMARDRVAWIEAIVAAAADPGAPPTALALTTSAKLRPAAPSGAAEVAAEWNGSVWSSQGRRTFTPAAQWLDTFANALPGERRAIVLVTGNVLPEHWVHPPFDRHAKERTIPAWTMSLLDGGAYWDPEAVAAAARKRRTTLVVVAPEVRFGDEAPIDDRPEVPYASRPRVRVSPAAVPRNGKPQMRRAPSVHATARAMMADEMKRRGLDDAAVAIALARKDEDAAKDHDVSDAGRFDSSLPDWFALWGDALPWNTDVPSGYGWWPLVRAAAATGGAFVLAPTTGAGDGNGGARWLDDCPRDAALLDALAPPLVARDRVAAAAKGDFALSAMLRAQAAAIDDAPWADYSKGYSTEPGGLWGWCGWALPGPSPARRWEPRRKPIDQEYRIGDARATRDVAQRAADGFARGARILAAAVADPRLASSPRRAQANLRVVRFWFEMSRFHLDSLALASRDPVAFGAKDAKAADHSLAWWNLARMSDCLPAYDGRVLTAIDETWYGPKWKRGDGPQGFQGHFLAIGTGDPNFRAERDPEQVLRHLDPRLREQALAVIAAGRDVMAHEARSPWGWVTYYSVLKSYAWDPSDLGASEVERGGAPPSTSGGATTPR